MRCWSILFGLLLGGCQVVTCVAQEPITFNGNFLFYNAPVAQQLPGTETEYVAYVNRWGAVMVSELNVKKDSVRVIGEEIIHEYFNVINRDRGYADDHAAPALLFDPVENRLLLATAYHGSDLYLYEKKLGRDESFQLIKHIRGLYTYPRLLTYRGKTYLFLRLQQKAKRLGHLVMRSSQDNFSSDQVVIPSDEEQVIYASVPAVFPEGVMIQYSTLSYETGVLEGWKLVHYDPENRKIVQTVDYASHIPMNCISNRPTGISVFGDRVIMATACFESGHQAKKTSERFFTRKNHIRVISVDLNKLYAIDVELLHEAVTFAPYYHTSVAVHEDGTWLYFDDQGIRSNELMPTECPRAPRMYPNLTDGALYFVRPISKFYEIRNFQNAIYRCNRN